ncbi:MAG: MATE family efflux transporter [Lentisphaerae bacterium]|nr:MATE family efflux transporter [Lentisphaerota bacterium]
MKDGAQNDLTEGRLGVGLFRLAGPMLLSSVLQNIQSLIDLFWVGRLGSSSVAAMALSGTILMMIFPLVMGMSAGTVALISRRVGEQDYEQASDTAGQSLGLALVLGLVAGVIGFFLAQQLCLLLGASPDVAALATEYLQVSFLGCFTVFVLFIGGHSIFQAAGNTVIPMLVMVLANVLNLILDPILIFGMWGAPALGIRGAALATVAAQAVAAIVAVSLLGSGLGHIHIHPRRLLPKLHIVLAILRIGLPGSAQMLARSLMALVLMHIVASCGTAAMAGYGIGLRFQMIILMPSFALANAAATIVGQNLGAQRPDRAHRGAWLAALWAVALMLVMGAVLIGCGPGLVRVFDDSPEVVAVGGRFLRITTGFFVFAALAIVLSRALMGAGDTVSPMICTFIALWGIQVPLAVGLSRILDPATDGIWWAVAVALTIHGFLVTAWFQTGRWKHRHV